jgi:hypothetical protein
MNADKALSIGSSIVVLAMVTVVVSHPQSAKIIKATGSAFAGAVKTAMGR